MITKHLVAAAHKGRFIHFLFVGGTGFVIDAILMYVLVGIGWHYLAARLVSFSVSVVATFWLNKYWTFSYARGRMIRRSALYIAVQLAGGVVNLAVFWLTATLLDLKDDFLIVPLLFGSAAAISLTYSGSRFLVFRPGA